MSVIFSRACEYAIRALAEMARHPEQEYWQVQDLANQAETPAPFLAKTFQILVKGRILKSTKGRRGGFSFARSVNKISLMDIVKIIDGTTLTADCALGFPECDADNPCPFHAQWADIRNSIIQALRSQSLDQFAKSFPLFRSKA
ncbi:MAG: RrF2 family transcriptional regulator [bacterium]